MADINRIEKLEYDNFAGSGKVSIDFNPEITSIQGPNGSGKTTVHKAFNYLLFDKNESDRKDFSIKNTKDKSRNDQQTIVSGIWNKNGSRISLKKIFSEKWTKKHGTTKPVFDGHTTDYFYDEVKISKGEYDAKIKALIDESISKLLTNVGFFNKMPWAKQREEILRLVPEVKDIDVAAGNENFEGLLASLTNAKTLEEYKKEIRQKIKDMADEQKYITPRIDQVLKGKPKASDFGAMRIELQSLTTQLEEVDNQIQSELEQQSVKNQAKVKIQGEINTFRAEKQELEFSIKQEYHSADQKATQAKKECREKIDNEERSLSSSQNKLKLLEAELAGANSKLEDINKEWDQVSASKYEPLTDGACVKCGFDPGAEDREKSFAKKKNEQLFSINTRGPLISTAVKEAKAQIEEMQQSIKTINETLVSLRAEFLELNKENTEARESLESVISRNPRINEIILAITAKEDEIGKDEPVDQEELKTRKKHLTESIDFLKEGLYDEKLIYQADLAIQELKTQESTQAQKQADLEKIAFNIKAFEHAKINVVEEAINAKFSYTKWKLFDSLNDGTLVETCEALCDSTPWVDANTASRIKCSLDIIQTLQDFYSIKAPIFLDNAESIQELPQMSSQLIVMSVGGATFTVN